MVHIFFLFCALKWLHKSFFISDNYKLQNLAYYFSKCKLMYLLVFFSFFLSKVNILQCNENC